MKQKGYTGTDEMSSLMSYQCPLLKLPLNYKEARKIDRNIGPKKKLDSSSTISTIVEFRDKQVAQNYILL